MKNQHPDNKVIKVAIVLLGSMIYACMYALGFEINEHGTCAIPAVLKRMVSSFPLLAVGLTALLFLSQKRFERPTQNGRLFRPGVAFIVLLISYVMYWITVFPGHFTYDTPNQMLQILNNRYKMHHPLIHTMLLRCFMSLRGILGSVYACTIAYTGFQICLIALLFVLSCASIARSYGASAGWYACAFFALFPMHACFATQMTKDSLFAAFLTLFFALCVENIEKGRCSRKLHVQMVTTGVMATLFRNNMMYAMIVWGILLLVFIWHADKKNFLLRLMCVVLLAYGSGKMMQLSLNAKPVDLREMLSWPAQQLARAHLKAGDSFNGWERNMYKRFLSDDSYLMYNPSISDPIKDQINKEKLIDDPDGFLQLYLSVGRKCKQEYLDAVAALISPFLYPYPNYNMVDRPYVETGIKAESFDEHYGHGTVVQNPSFVYLRKWMDANIWRNGAADIPVIRWIFNLGVVSWGLLFLVIREAYFCRWNRFAVYLLPVLYWGTCLLGPIMQGRYAYPLMCVLPIMLCQKRENAQRMPL